MAAYKEPRLKGREQREMNGTRKSTGKDRKKHGKRWDVENESV
jgi:hypothetical protein